MKKYKYSRKEWLEYYQELEKVRLPVQAQKDLLTKESNEEYSQRIMMEQVPKQEDNKECKLEKAKREWKRKGWDVNQIGSVECFCPKCYSPTPSQLDDIDEIEELDSGTILGLYRMANRLIRNQNLIIKQLKQK